MPIGRLWLDDWSSAKPLPITITPRRLYSTFTQERLGLKADPSKREREVIDPTLPGLVNAAIGSRSHALIDRREIAGRQSRKNRRLARIRRSQTSKE